MRALIYHKLTPLVDRLKKELTDANNNIRFSETEINVEALALFIIYKPEIIIIDVDQKEGCGNEFLQNIKKHVSDIKEISLSNHPSTKIILLNFQNAEIEEG